MPESPKKPNEARQAERKVDALTFHAFPRSGTLGDASGVNLDTEVEQEKSRQAEAADSLCRVINVVRVIVQMACS